MITVHHEKETDFSKNGYGSIDDYVFGAEVNWELNGQFSAYLEYPTFLDKANNLVNKNILRVPVPFMDDQLFRIYRTRKVLGFIQIEARHIFYDLMDNLIEDTNIVGKTGSQAIQQLLGATQYEHRFIGFSDISTSNNARMVRYNPVEALLDDSKANTFVSRWDGEVVRDNFVIRMVRQMGTDRGVRIQHRKDLTAYIATIDESTVVTRIMPVGFDGLKLPELYIDSPLLDPDNPKIGVIRYENVKAAVGEYADDNGSVPLEEAYDLLREHARAEFSNNHIDEPEMTVTVNFVTLHNTREYADFAQLQEIHQGDVVRVSVPDEDFEITSRLVAFTSDPLQQNHYTSTTLGNHVYEFTSSTNSVSTLRNEVEALRESVVEVRQSANGKNQNFWGEADPNTLNLNAILGDTYFRSVGEEDVIYQYVEVDGERYWKEIINTANTSEVKKEVERVAEEAEKLADDITEAQQSADDAKRDAGLALTASEALEIITQETASQLSDTRGLLATVESNASEALSQASGAITQAGQAVLDAQTAMGNAQSALSKASDTESTVTTLSTDIDTIAGKVALKADQTVVDTISGTVSTHTTTLSQHATAISSKAEQTEVDTVKGTVSTHTSTLEQQAKEISARLTQSQVDSLVSDKGYSTVSYVDTEISATAGAIRTEMTAVEGKIPTEIGGRNLYRDSGIATVSSGYNIRQYNFATKPIGGEKYTLSIKGKINPEKHTGYYVNIHDGSAHPAMATVGPSHLDSDGVYRITFTMPNLKDYLSSSLYSYPLGHYVEASVEWIKLEKGNIATDWSPAPEDSMKQSDFNTFKGEYEQSAKGWDAKLLQIEQADYASKSWSNQTFATPQSVTTQLQSYAKSTDLNGLATETYVGSQISATAKTIRTEITSVEGKIPSEIGGRNLYLNSEIERTTTRFIDIPTNDAVSHLVGQPVTVSFDIKLGNGGISRPIEVYRYQESGIAPDVNGFITPTTEWVRHNFTGTVLKTAVPSGYTTGAVGLYDRAGYNNYMIKNVKIEKGSLATHWSLAPEDMATSKQVSSIEQKADSIQALVGKTNDSVARAVMTSNLWETEVSKVIDSELEQEYETVLSPVHVLNETDHNGGETFSLGKYFNYSGLTRDVPTYLQTGVKHVLEITMPATQNKGQFVYVQTKNLEGKWVSIGASFNLPTGQHKIVREFTSAVFSTSTADYRLVLENGGNPAVSTIYSMRIYRNDEVQVPIEGGNTGAISTKITQLYDMINLSVLGKEGAMSRIAMGEEGIQIDGKLLHITAKTFIDDAVIKSAMIDTLDAGKITTGELNAKNVKVINLDANSISGNEASFIKAMFTNKHSSLQITGDGIDVSKSNGDRTFSVDSGGARFYSDTGAGAYITTHDIMNWNGTKWVDTGSNSVMFAADLNHSIGIGYKIWDNGQYVTRNAIRLDRAGSGTPELQINLPIKNLVFTRGSIGGADGSYLRNNQNTAGIWMGDNGLFYIKEAGSLYGSGWWKNK